MTGHPVTGIVDAHQHFWRPGRGDYGWLTPALAPLYRDFMPEHLAPLLQRHGVAGTVLVQAVGMVRGFLAGLSADERAAVLGGNAERVYRLGA